MSEEEYMDVDAAGTSGTVIESKSVMAGSTTIPSVTILLHPLVIMNVSEHYTRIRAQKGSRDDGIYDLLLEGCIQLKYLFFLVFGALIGKQKGRKVEILNSFELKIDIEEGETIINKEYYNTKEEQCEFFYILLKFYN